MKYLNKIFDNIKVAMVVSDPDLNVTYANERCKEVFKALLNEEDFVGKNMRECHKPETIETISALYEEYREKKKSLDYYTMDIPDGKATVVNVPFYDGDTFAGVVEFVFESSLA
ncbi:MAG: PAS domain-containing protein [Deltaproteobacteria bacterium]|nr:PAS domain-containing protein [Deltaproteobacteria bacterium]